MGNDLESDREDGLTRRKDEPMGYDGKAVLEYINRTHDTTLLTEREKHLIGLAVTITRGCQVCTRGRIEKARTAGMSDDVLNALVGVVSAVNAGVAAATGREGFRQATLPQPRVRSAVCRRGCTSLGRNTFSGCRT